MKVHVRTKDCTLDTLDEKMLERRIRRLRRRLTRFDPDLVHLEVVIEHHARRDEYTGSVRLTIMNRPLVARREAAPQVRTFLHQAFDDLETELERFKAKLTGEAERKHAGPPPVHSGFAPVEPVG